MPDAEGAQSPPVAHRDDSLATNPSAGLVAEDHPPKRRGGWRRAGVFAVAAWLVWVAWPTAAFAVDPPELEVNVVAGDNTINSTEKENGFFITGNTGTEEDVEVKVTIGGTLVDTVDSDTNGNWSVEVGQDESYIVETVEGYVTLLVTATNGGGTTTVSRVVPVDLTAPTVTYTAPGSLEVGNGIEAINPINPSDDIESYAIDVDSSLLRGLSLAGDTGVISGTPTTGNPDPQTTQVLVTDTAGNTGMATINFPLVVGNVPKVTVAPSAEELAKDSDEGLIVREGDSKPFTVVLDTEPTHNVTIEVTRASGDTDLTVTPDTLPFTTEDWNTPQTVTVRADEDTDGVRGTANFRLNAVSSDTVYNGISTPGVKVTEDDDDTIDVIISTETLTVPEGGSATYTVKLGTKPLEDVTLQATRDQLSDENLTVKSGKDTDTTTDSVTLPFTTEDWNTPQTVTVSAAEDDDQVNGVAIFSHQTASGGVDYDEFTADSITATEADNDKDVIRPRVEIQTEVSALVGGAFEVTIRFSEIVRGFTLADISVSNGTASDLNSVPFVSYTAKITPEETGEVRVEVRSNVTRDGAGNGNRAAEPLVIEADLERSEVTIEGPTEPVGMAGFEVMITFSEPVEGFELGDIRVTNGTASNFTKVSPREYTATITPEGTGEVKVEVRSNVARDGASNGNRAAEPLVIETDLERPEVTYGKYFTEAVQWSVDNNITGIDGDCFSPDSGVSRGDAAVYLWNMAGRPPAPAHSFVDVTDDIQDAAVSWMSHHNITTGTTETTFDPDATLTRAHLVTFLWRLAGEPEAPAHHFVDVHRPWQQASVSWASHTQITTGTSATTFAPETTLTRAHVITFLWRYQGKPQVTVDADTPICDPTDTTEPQPPDTIGESVAVSVGNNTRMV